MPRLFNVCAALVMLAMPATAIANDVAEACRNFARAEMIFVGRVKSTPITRRISGEENIEKARIAMHAAENELKAFEALKVPPEIGSQRHRDLSIRMVKAREEFDHTRAMYPPPMDIRVTPILVEVPLRGATTTDLFLQGPDLDPAQSYLFYAQRPLGRIAPDVISLAARPKEAETAQADLRFLNEAIANNPGTVVSGSLRMEDPHDQARLTPLPGVVLRVSLDGQHYETSTGADGTFLVTGVPPGVLRIDPVLPEQLTLPPQPTGGNVRGGCLEVHMRATFNGKIRGRVLLDDGTPFRGLVDVISDDTQRHHSRVSPVSTNERGEFMFTALSPGSYRVGVNLARQPTSSAPFRPTYFPGTTDPSLSTPVIVGMGSELADLDWVVNSRLREGAIEVTFDTHGQPQKNMGVCVTTFDADDRNNGGFGHERRSDEPVVVQLVEGVKYRLVAYAQTPAGLAKSETFDFIGTPGRRSVRLSMASTSAEASGMRCASDLNEPFSPQPF